MLSERAARCGQNVPPLPLVQAPAYPCEHMLCPQNPFSLLVHPGKAGGVAQHVYGSAGVQASRKPHKLHREASVPQGEYCYLQSPLMTFMADDIDLEQPPFTMLIGKRPGMSFAHPTLTVSPQTRACLAGCIYPRRPAKDG